jgi:hypothetical protein
MLRGMSSEGAKAFITRWAAASASERANSQPFLCELCDLLGVARPEPTRETGYAFKYGATEHHSDGSTTKVRCGTAVLRWENSAERASTLTTAVSFVIAQPEPMP